MSKPQVWWWRRPGLNWLELLGLALGCALVGGSLGALAAIELSPGSGSCDVSRVATSVRPAVVTVFSGSAEVSSAGSGVVIRADGLILTTAQVVSAAVESGTIEVLLNGGVRTPGQLVGSDPVSGLALVKVEPNKLPALLLAPRESLQVGQPVAALGSPLAEAGTVSSGVIGALGRNVPVPEAGGGTTELVGAIQTDAVNAGNSGGPLVTCEGHLIGLNLAVPAAPGTSDGVGYAVPASLAQRVVTELLRTGEATHPWLGAATAEVSADLADRFGSRPGLLVQATTPAGPAVAAGLRVGDVLSRLGNEAATNASLAQLLATAEVGDVVKVEFYRNGQLSSSELTLTEQPG